MSKGIIEKIKRISSKMTTFIWFPGICNFFKMDKYCETEKVIGKVTLMLHWYCKTTYNLGQFFFQSDVQFETDEVYTWFMIQVVFYFNRSPRVGVFFSKKKKIVEQT